MSRINQPIAAGFLGASAFNKMLLSKGSGYSERLFALLIQFLVADLSQIFLLL